MRKTAYITALVFALALAFQLSTMAATTVTTHKQTKTVHKKATPAHKGKGPAAQTVRVTLTATGVTLDKTTLPAGKTTIIAKNDTKMPMQLEVKGKGMTKKTPEIAAGQTRQITVDLKKGKYNFESLSRGRAVRGEKPAVLDVT